MRLSGADAFDVMDRVAKSSTPRSRGLHRFRVDDRLPVLVAVFPAPRSYTGEDSVEVQLAGNPTLLERLVEWSVRAGARRAEPGEFTARAFFHGRLTLTEAEGVAATIGAASDAQLRAARMLTEGRLGVQLTEVSTRLAEALALVEAGIDFVDQEDVVAIGADDLRVRIETINRSIQELLERSTGSERLEAIPSVVLVGPPNAGKSTLFNALLGRDRAVTSARPGATRDVLVEPMRLIPDDPFGPEIMLIDLAGLDDRDGGLNPIMQRAALRAIDRADLVLRLEPSDDPVDSGLSDLLSSAAQRKPTIVVHSKSDRRPPPLARGQELSVSAVSGEGLPELRRQIARACGELASSLSANELALLPRHRETLDRAAESLSNARRLVEPQPDPRRLVDSEFVAAELRLALDALGELGGRITPDEVLGRVFASFCVGK